MKAEKESLEIRLLESEDRYKEMLDLLSDIIFETDCDLNMSANSNEQPARSQLIPIVKLLTFPTKSRHIVYSDFF